jgi:peptidoglycan/xylan/chitin deacetylase (PgdA/CDA1 family)
MKQTVFSFFFFIVRYSGLAELVRFCCARNRVTILMYHNPKYSVFEKHLDYLTRRYNLISASDLVNALDAKDFSHLPNYALLLTFDDGWKENYELLPLIKQYNCRPIIFLASDMINTHRRYWWTICKPEEAVALKKIPNTQRQIVLKEKFDYEVTKEYPKDRQVLNLIEIEDMKAHVDFGLHTATHPILTSCNSVEKKIEIEQAKVKLEELLQTKVYAFSYPNGDYDPETKELLKDNGIAIARTINVGWTDAASDRYQLRVTGVSDTASESKLITEMTGLSMYIQYLLKGSLNGTKEKNY